MKWINAAIIFTLLLTSACVKEKQDVIPRVQPQAPLTNDLSGSFKLSGVYSLNHGDTTYQITLNTIPVDVQVLTDTSLTLNINSSLFNVQDTLFLQHSDFEPPSSYYSLRAMDLYAEKGSSLVYNKEAQLRYLRYYNSQYNATDTTYMSVVLHDQ